MGAETAESWGRNLEKKGRKDEGTRRERVQYEGNRETRRPQMTEQSHSSTGNRNGARPGNRRCKRS